jgi:hypothetical protein
MLTILLRGCQFWGACSDINLLHDLKLMSFVQKTARRGVRGWKTTFKVSASASAFIREETCDLLRRTLTHPRLLVPTA